MPVLNARVVADKYPDQTGAVSGAILANVWNARGGWFSVSGATAFVRLQYGKQGDDHWVEEIFLGAGAFVVLPPNCVGLQFRNGVAGVNATVTAQIAQGNEPALAISTIGQTNTVLVSSLNFQHGGAAVGTEPTLNLIDAPGVLSWTMTDNVAQTRVDVTPFFPNPVLIPGTLQIGNADTFLSRSSANTLDLGNSGTRGALRLFASATTDVELSVRVTADANPRFTLGGDGTLTWGPGSAATDVTMARSAANQLDLGTTAQEGKLRLFGAAAGDLALQLLVTTDTNPRLTASYAGTLSWGPGNAATDIGLNRPLAGQLAFTVQGSTLRSLHITPGAVGGDGVNAGWAILDQGSASHQFFQSCAPAGFNSLATTVIADATDWRFLLDTTGAMSWGPGNAARDVQIFRAVQTVASLVVAKGAFGYATGQAVGGAVTQATSFNTGVTLNKICGVITLFTSATIAGTVSTFVVTNSTVAATDVVILSWGTGINTGALLSVANVAAGSFTITWEAVSSQASSTRTINFAVIKSANN